MRDVRRSRRLPAAQIRYDLSSLQKIAHDELGDAASQIGGLDRPAKALAFTGIVRAGFLIFDLGCLSLKVIGHGCQLFSDFGHSGSGSEAPTNFSLLAQIGCARQRELRLSVMMYSVGIHRTIECRSAAH